MSERKPAGPVVQTFKGIVKLAAIIIGVGFLFTIFTKTLAGPDRHGITALEENRPIVGAWLGDWPSGENDLIADFAEKTGIEPDIVDIFLDWYTPFDNVSHAVREVANSGAIPMLTWEAHAFTTPAIVAGTAKTPLRDGRSITLGEYLEEFSKGTCDLVRATGQPVIVRALHEMNGNWFHWGLSFKDAQGNRPNTPENYKAAWIKIHDAFTSKCPDGGVLFMFALNHFSVGDGASFLGGYPGDEYVDLIGIDGYNWGGNAGWGWQSFDTIMGPGYCAVVKATSKPIFLAETASTEKGGDKAAWIRDAFARMGSSQYKQVEGIVYFNDAKYEVEIKGNMDWPVDSSPAALAAFRESAAAFHSGEIGSRPPPAGGGPPC